MSEPHALRHRDGGATIRRAHATASWAKRSGAEGGNRTPTPRREPDFESGASASSATSARDRIVAWLQGYPGRRVRTRLITMVVLLLVALAVAVAGCGSSTPKKAIPAAAAAPLKC